MMDDAMLVAAAGLIQAAAATGRAEEYWYDEVKRELEWRDAAHRLAEAG